MAGSKSPDRIRPRGRSRTEHRRIRHTGSHRGAEGGRPWRSVFQGRRPDRASIHERGDGDEGARHRRGRCAAGGYANAEGGDARSPAEDGRGHRDCEREHHDCAHEAPALIAGARSGQHIHSPPPLKRVAVRPAAGRGLKPGVGSMERSHDPGRAGSLDEMLRASREQFDRLFRDAENRAPANGNGAAAHPAPARANGSTAGRGGNGAANGNGAGGAARPRTRSARTRRRGRTRRPLPAAGRPSDRPPPARSRRRPRPDHPRPHRERAAQRPPRDGRGAVPLRDVAGHPRAARRVPHDHRSRGAHDRGSGA